MGCSLRPAFHDWARCGCNVELSPELTLHSRICGTCNQFVTEVTIARQMGREIPVHRIAPSRLQRMQALLHAETQRLPSYSHLVTRRRRPWPWLAVVAIGLLAGTVGVAAVHVGGQLQKAPPVATGGQTLPAVIVGLSAGARGHATSPLLDAPYELEDGYGEFDVGKIGDGRTFRVIAGGYVVEASRAHFRLHVSNAALESVEVSAGRVMVRDGDATVAILGEGQAFSPVAPRTPPAKVGSGDTTPQSRNRQKSSRQGYGAPDDSAFAAAYRLMGAGQPERAAVAFDALLGRAKLDASRRADVLYWSCQAHARAGNAALAEARARTYLASFPNSLHYGDVALLLGDYARGRGANEIASDYYMRALRAARPATRAKAQESLKLVGQVG